MKIKKVLSLALIATMILSMTVTPAFAASTTPNSTENVETGTFTDHADGTEAVEVTATVASTYTVTIPKKITMDGANKVANYTVTVSGDIADNETVTVAPDASFLMNTAKGDKDAVTATIEQSKTEWKYNEFATQATGSISAPLTAGEWNGSFNFAISLEAEEIEYRPFSVTQNDIHLIGFNLGEQIDWKYPNCDTSLVIPETFQDADGTWYKVTSIATFAFDGCTNLNSIVIPSSVTVIGEFAFNGCDNLTSATFENISGWTCYASMYDDYISSLDLSNPTTNAQYLINTYDDYLWTRS